MKANELDPEYFVNNIKEQGYCIVENVIGAQQVARLRLDARRAIDAEATFHGSTNYPDYGVVQACPMYGGELLQLLESKHMMEPFNLVMGEGSILYTYITSSMPPGRGNASVRVHVDRPRVFQNYCECLAGLLLLDDFTIDNGGTLFMPASHNRVDAPSEREFMEKAIYLEAKAGSVFYFNLRLWHSGGKNNTDHWRHALALGVVRPYLKQRFDLPRMLTKHQIDVSTLSKYALQKLGYDAIIPASLQEFYGPIETRTYREKSEWEMVKLGF